jgi:murein DD-endopeptidase MepM/ murein hydrolase activator NlpD
MTTHTALAVLLRTAALGLAAGLAACGGGESESRAAVEIRGTDPTSGAPMASSTTDAAVAAVPTASVAAPDGSGVVDYGSYQAVVASEGDTVADLASRVGLSASELAAYNGLTPSHALRAGDELVLPARPGGYAGTMVAAAPAAETDVAPLDSAIETAPLPGAEAPADDAAMAEDDAAMAEAGADGGWSPDLAAAAIERSTGLNPDGSLGAPPSSAEPMPPEPEPRRELASPDLGQYQTGSTGASLPPPGATTDVAAAAGIEDTPPAGPSVRLTRPVEGPVAIGFSKEPGPARNDGVDFAAPAGSPVVAAADGEVALVSQSLGGLGTIVLLRHPNDLLTVYGRVDGVTVQKGEIVEAGQTIGVVSDAAPPGEPRMHFEVRRGAESLDPMEFL